MSAGSRKRGRAAQEETFFTTAAPGDHAETPLCAYRDIAPILSHLAARLRKPCSQLKIYDPYYCKGAVAAHLSALGFKSVYNRNEDFYQVVAQQTVPEFDVLVTNPPFSGDNIERIFALAVQWGKPFFLLLPQYIHRKAFYLEWLRTWEPQRQPPRPVYLGPSQAPYSFSAPAFAQVQELRARRSKRAPDTTATAAGSSASTSGGCGGDFGVFSGHFQCIWFLSLGREHHAATLEWWRRECGDAEGAPAMSEEVEALPQLCAAPKLTPAERRWRKKLAASADPAEGAGMGRGGGQGTRGRGRGSAL